MLTSMLRRWALTRARRRRREQREARQRREAERRRRRAIAELRSAYIVEPDYGVARRMLAELWKIGG